MNGNYFTSIALGLLLTLCGYTASAQDAMSLLDPIKPPIEKPSPTFPLFFGHPFLLFQVPDPLHATKWINQTRILSPIDTNGNALALQIYQWNTTKNNWDTTFWSSMRYQYNASRKASNMRRRVIVPSGGKMFDLRRNAKYYYDINGLPQTAEYLDSVPYNAVWLLVQSKDELTFSGTDLLDRTNYVLQGVTYNENSRILYNRTSGKITEVLTQNFYNNNWHDTLRTLYTWDANGHIVTAEDLVWNGSAWANSKKNTYSYGSGRITDEIDATWNGSSWTQTKNTYTFSGNGLMTAIYNYNYNGTAWVNNTKSLVTYNANNAPMEIDVYSWTGSAWSPNISGRYMYYEPTVTPPAMPSGLTVTNVGRRTLQISWTNNAIDQAGFLLYRTTDTTSLSSWKVVDSANAGGTSYTDTALKYSTTYYYKVAAWNAGGLSAATKIVSGTTLSNGIANFDEARFSIYPNPCRGELNLYMPQESGKLRLVDVLGRSVYQQEVRNGNQKIDLSGLPDGSYIILIQVSDKTLTEKIIIGR